MARSSVTIIWLPTLISDWGLPSACSGRQGWGRRIPGKAGTGNGAALWTAYAAGMIVVGIIASHSRGGFLAMMTALGTTVVLLRPKSIRPRVGVGVMLVMIPLLLAGMGTASPFQRLATLLDSKEVGDLSGRTEVSARALRAWQVHPFWGAGLGSFPAATTRFFQIDHGVFYAHTENEWLQVLAEGGVVGVGLALAFWTGVVRLVVQARRSATSDRTRAPLLGALISLVALGVQCLGDFPLHIPGVAVAIMVLVGHLCRMGLEAEAEAAPMPSPAGVGAGPRRVGAILAHLVMIGLGLAIVGHGIRWARAEATVAAAGLPWPGTELPPSEPRSLSRPELERVRTALQRAVRTGRTGPKGISDSA